MDTIARHGAASGEANNGKFPDDNTNTCVSVHFALPLAARSGRMLATLAERLRAELSRLEAAAALPSGALVGLLVRGDGAVEQVFAWSEQWPQRARSYPPQGGAGSRAAVARDDAFVIGRHSQSDVVMVGREASLRHAVVLPRRTDEGLRVTVVDLKSQVGCMTLSGEIVDRAELKAPCALSLGAHLLLLAPRALLDDPEALVAGWLGTAALPPPAEPRSGSMWEVVVNIFPDGAELTATDVPSPRDVRGLLTRDAAEPTLAGAFVPGETALLGQRPILVQQRHVVTQQELWRGVLLGRASRCLGPGADGPDTVSRVHGLLLSVDGALHYIDTASSGGTQRCVSAAAYAATQAGPVHSGDQLLLADTVAVQLRALGEQGGAR